MLTFQTLEDSHKFLLLETVVQVDATIDFFSGPKAEIGEEILARSESIHQLKNALENACFTRTNVQSSLSNQETHSIRAIHRMALCFRRIAQYCANMVRQAEHLGSDAFLRRFDCKALFSVVRLHLKIIPADLRELDESDALALCRCEARLDELFAQRMGEVTAAIKADLAMMEDGVTTIFILRYLERIGDELLRIGEALLSVVVGERIKVQEFTALRQGLSRLEPDDSLGNLSFRAIWGSRSGCVIGRVTSHSGERIFKECGLKKGRKEREHLEYWNAVMPGLAPKIYNYEENAETSSLLVEFLRGVPLDEALLAQDDLTRQRANAVLLPTLQRVWDTTLRRETIRPDFMEQLLRRLERVRQVHPDFCSSGLERSNLLELVEECRKVESRLVTDWTIMIHGDFNLNNIFYDQSSETIHYVDLYRSRRADALQDVSVYLVSNFRIPVFEKEIRRRIWDNMSMMHDFARKYAHEHGDASFHVRLGLALARSLFTSTRFELDESFARVMFQRAHELLREIAELDQVDIAEYRPNLSRLDYDPRMEIGQDALVHVTAL